MLAACGQNFRGKDTQTARLGSFSLKILIGYGSLKDRRRKQEVVPDVVLLNLSSVSLTLMSIRILNVLRVKYSKKGVSIIWIRSFSYLWKEIKNGRHQELHLTYLIGKELSVFTSPIISDGNLWLSTMPVKLAKMKKKMIWVHVAHSEIRGRFMRLPIHQAFITLSSQNFLEKCNLKTLSSGSCAIY